MIEGYSLWINSYTDNYEICMECYIAMVRSKGDVAAPESFPCYRQVRDDTVQLEKMPGH